MPVHDIEEGIRYACQRCGNCCRWRGDVVVSASEIERIAAFLEMDVDAFIDRHTALRENRQGLTLLEREDGSCAFLDGRDCTIQPVKPGQCAGFPNEWNFPGWRESCEAVPVRIDGTDAPLVPSTHPDTQSPGRTALAPGARPNPPPPRIP